MHFNLFLDPIGVLSNNPKWSLEFFLNRHGYTLYYGIWDTSI